MLTYLRIVDLTAYHDFVWYPVKDAGDDCVIAITDKDDKSPVLYYSVYGKKAVVVNFVGEVEVEDAIADFTMPTEATTYCILLNAALEGRIVEFKKE